MSHSRLLAPGIVAALSFLSLTHSSAKELDGVYTPFPGPCPSVDEQIKKVTLPAGYALRNFAAEPLVINPVAMTWDARGRLWVVELYEYPLGAKKPNEYSKTATDENFHLVVKTDATSPRDRVIILEDTDNDGVADKRTVFVEGLNLATAILCGHGGVFVGQAPNLFFFRDTDGDDKADDYKTVLTGFGLEDRHELLNSFTWGPDGYMYFTHGVFTHSKVRRPTDPKENGVTLNAGIYRVSFARGVGFQPTREETKDARVGKDADPTVSRHEVFADGTSNPWGCDYDAAGNWFVEACVIDHLFHMAPGGLYQRQGGAPENPYAYELLPSIVNHKHFRAAYAGIQVYQGGVYPEDTHGHLFFGNIHDNSIHEERVEPVGATFKASSVRDFLRANDGWFRPVSIQTGPDGFLWVMDWCDKYPCYQNANANPEGVDREKGRIWRIVHGKGEMFPSRPDTAMDLAKLPPARLVAELVAELETGNSWMRRQIIRILAERVGEPVVALEIVAIAGLLDRADSAHLLALAGARIPLANPFAAAQVIGEAGAPDAADLASLGRLALSKDSMVRAAVATAFRQVGVTGLTTGPLRANSAEPTELAARLVEASRDDVHSPLSFAIWMGIEPRLAARPESWIPWLAGRALRTKPLSLELTYKTMRRLCDTRKAENLDLAFSYLDTVGADGDLVATALDGLVKGQEAGAIKPTKDPAAHLEKWSKSEREDIRRFAQQLATLWGDPKAVVALMGVVLDEKADVAQRIDAIRTVRRLKSDQARAGILKLFDSKSSPDALTIETLRAAGELGGRDLAEAILKAWQGYGPAVKSAAAEVMVTRTDWAKRLLDGVEGKWVGSGAINPSDIPVSVRRRLAQDNDLKDRAAQVLGRWNETGADVKALIAAKKRACLEGEPDLAAGKVVFTVTCAVCHPFHGGGQGVGPDLIGSGRSNLEALLVNVIDPNQIIGNGYQNFLVTTKDGRTVSGRVLEDTPTQVTLFGIGGAKQVVPRGEIAEMKDTGQSTMPAGFGALPDEVFRNLIWYILAPPEEGPLTKEKKEALSRSIDSAPAVPSADQKKSVGDPAEPRPDRESASLWNPEWQLDAPDFEGTPTKLPEYHGRKNVLELHPYDEQKPSALVRRLDLPKDKPASVSVWVASHDEGDWQLTATANGQPLGKPQTIDHAHPDARWTKATFDLEKFAGQKLELRLENRATDWFYEFSYWSDLRVTW